jgi:hypothetical protein
VSEICTAIVTLMKNAQGNTYFLRHRDVCSPI